MRSHIWLGEKIFLFSLCQLVATIHLKLTQVKLNLFIQTIIASLSQRGFYNLHNVLHSYSSNIDPSGEEMGWYETCGSTYVIPLELKETLIKYTIKNCKDHFNLYHDICVNAPGDHVMSVVPPSCEVSCQTWISWNLMRECDLVIVMSLHELKRTNGLVA